MIVLTYWNLTHLLLLQQKLINAVNNFLETEKEIAHFVKEAEMIPPLLHSYSDVIDSNSPLKIFQAKQSQLCLRSHIQYKWASTWVSNVEGDQEITEVGLINQTLSKDIIEKISNLKIRNPGFKANCTSEWVCQALVLHDLRDTYVHKYSQTDQKHLP